jgi:TolB protein
MIKISFFYFFYLCFLNITAQEYSVLFTKQINGSDHIFKVNNKGDLQQITNHRRKDSSPVSSPDGEYIVFASERIGWWKIWIKELKSGRVSQLTESSTAEYSPSWSPDGQKIVFISSRDGNSEIYTMARDGSNLSRVTKNSKTDAMPSWGNDGFIYYTSEVNGLYQLCKILPDGKQKEILTSDGGNKFNPSSSLDGQWILMDSDRDGNREIYLFNLSSKKYKRLTQNSQLDIRPKWSPDNHKIVFERGNKKDNQHIYMMDASGKNQQQLTFRNYNYAPSFVTTLIDK